MATVAAIRRDFGRLLERNRLAHGYILFGRARHAAFAIARGLGNALETGSWDAAVAPLLDFMDVFAAEGRGGIETVRSVQHFLAETPIRSLRRTCVVRDADQLTVPAEQALLKIAEEPPPHALLVLTALDPNALLPTLASRFPKVYVSGESDEVIPEALRAAAEEFRRADARARRELLKALGEAEQLEPFARALIAMLAPSVRTEWRTLRKFLRAYTLMQQYTVNKRLQMEAALLDW